MSCRRVESIAELVPAAMVPAAVVPLVATDVVVCQRCKKASMIEHHGGQWCTNCGRYVTEPDYKLLPSNQASYKEPERYEDNAYWMVCSWCDQKTDMTGGIYDDGEWMCGGCIASYINRKS